MTAAAPAAPWPLSAAATALLRDPRADDRELLKLTLKELILRGAYAVDRETRAGRRGRSTVTLWLRPGYTSPPALAPLALLERRIRSGWTAGAERTELRKVVERLPGTMAVGVRDAAREELRGRGLVELERRRVLGVFPRTTVTLTPSGASWRDGSYERGEAIAEAAGGRRADAAAQLVALGALVLFLAPAPLAELDALLRAREGADALVDTGLDGIDLDLSFLDGLGDALGSVFDGAFDSAVDAGGGGDGGGGDGGGGGE